ncbi:MAG: contractile injection system tape measure protein, partial [Thiomonas sp.]|nr:contractile injection system tape measure protein [Thiomonas sp.]
AATLAGDARALRDALCHTSRGTLAQRHAASFRLLQLLSADARTAVLALAVPENLPEDLPENRNEARAALLALLRDFALSLGGHLLLRVQAMLLALREADLRHPPDALIAGLLRDIQRQMAALADHDTVQTLLTLQAALGAEPAEVTPPRTTVRPPAGVVRSAEEAAPSLGHLVADAGLILLHPFLPRLFEVRHLSAGGSLPEANLPRAAALLHWLVNGREEVYEFELTLVKILLGLRPADPLPVSAGLLDEADRNEAKALLEASIEHWKTLGNTSVAALRETFLQRRGLLRDSDSGWRLQLEPAPYDLLLGSLPWSFSLVRLPWMNRPLHTEWPMP